MIVSGAYVMMFSPAAPLTRSFLSDVLGLRAFSPRGEWSNFHVPVVELGVHPAASPSLELYLKTDDLDRSVARLREAGVDSSPIKSQSWGWSCGVPLPDGRLLGLYQSR